MRTTTTDVLVIGSGFGAAAVARRLAEAGASVTLVEKGCRVGPGDFQQTQDPRYVTRFIKGVTGSHVNLTYAEALGGGSGFYEMVSLRAPSLAFDQVDPGTGRRLWPAALDRQAMDPWYDVAERELRVEQIAESEVPRTGLVFSLLLKRLGYSCERARYAVRNCLGSGFCVTGCVYGAKQSLHLNYLPKAEAAGAVVECDREAVAIAPILEHPPGGDALTRTPHRYLVETRSRTGAPPIRYRARIVVLGGGTVGTAALLLRSRKRLPRLTAHLGRNLAINGSVKMVGLLPDDFPDGDMFTGRSHPGMISYEFLASHGVTLAAVKALPLQIVAAARLRLDGNDDDAWWGQDHVRLMERFRHRAIAIASFGLTPPSGEVSLDRSGELVVSLGRSALLERHAREARGLITSLLERNGCRVVAADWIDRGGVPHDGVFFSTAHQTGTARMADRPEDGVVDVAGAVFGYPGLYVSDGAAIPSSLAVNTSLTILANAERIAAGILMRHGLAPHPGLVA
jgi:choline dehydrogenase-like flavoprotein